MLAVPFERPLLATAGHASVGICTLLLLAQSCSLLPGSTSWRCGRVRAARHATVFCACLSLLVCFRLFLASQLAERESEDGEVHYLVKWAGFEADPAPDSWLEEGALADVGDRALGLEGAFCWRL